MKEYIITHLGSILKKIGVALKKYPTPELDRRKKLMKHFEIDLVLDVGANVGQYAKGLRSIGYNGQIISFEPIPEVYALLTKNMCKDRAWKAKNYAFGEVTEEAEINVSRNFASSSILPINKLTIEIEPKTTYFKKEIIKVHTLSDKFKQITLGYDRLMLKLDVQGFEYNVLKGAEDCLSKFALLQLEMSLSELYKGEKLFDEILIYLKSKNFELCSLEPGFYHEKTGALLQVDGIFRNKIIK